MLTVWGPRFAWATGIGLTVLILGTAGYMIVEDASFGDSLYMTVITATAVGYREIIPLSPSGRIFTVILLMAGISSMGVWFATITSLLVDIDLRKAVRGRRFQKEIDAMKDHIIVCGAGRTGERIAREVADRGRNCVVIEHDPDHVRRLREVLTGCHVLEGDATTDNVLRKAGVQKAFGLVACVSDDADSLFICLSARAMSHELRIVARAYDQSSLAKMLLAGADEAVSPTVSAALSMASLMTGD